MIESGSLRHKIAITARDMDARDDYGAQLKNARVTVFSARANVKVLGGNELVTAGVQLGNEIINATMRYDSRLAHDQFVQWESKEYSIKVIKPDSRKLMCVVTAEREV